MKFVSLMQVHPYPIVQERPTPKEGSPLRIALCGETYSTNLGDEVIADSLAHLIRMHRPDAEVSLLDISGRAPTDRYPASVPKPKFDGERRRPRRWVQRLRELRRTTLAWMAPWQPPRHPYDLVVIGGGQLLMDNDLWFPSRLAMWHYRLKPHARAFAVHACGVGSEWSRPGRWFCRHLLKAPDMVGFSVRDEPSRDFAVRLLGIRPDRVSLVPDPALWAAEAYGTVRKKGSRSVGLGIMAPADLARGIESSLAGRLTPDVLMRFWTETIAILEDRGWEVSLFTNGAPEDHAFAEQVTAALSVPLKTRVSLCPRPTQPADLVGTIAGFRSVLAQRLHALVIACSLEIPFVGVVWDHKVRGFSALCGHPERVLEPGSLDAAAAVEALEMAVNAGLDPTFREDLRQRAANGVQRLLQDAGLS
jgi:polysaccharide pyruvyl transferase WcaK-like protein